jgi:hypothetical protein
MIFSEYRRRFSGSCSLVGQIAEWDVAAEVTIGSGITIRFEPSHGDLMCIIAQCCDRNRISRAGPSLVLKPAIREVDHATARHAG